MRNIHCRPVDKFIYLNRLKTANKERDPFILFMRICWQELIIRRAADRKLTRPFLFIRERGSAQSKQLLTSEKRQSSAELTKKKLLNDTSSFNSALC